MKLLKIVFAGVVLFLTFNLSLISCEKAACNPDIAVDKLTAVGSVNAGDVISVACELKNMVSGSCSTSSPGTVTIEHGFSPIFSNLFSDYQVFKIATLTLPAIAFGIPKFDDMPMHTDMGPGHYSMKITTSAPNDVNSANDSQAISIQAN